MLITPYDSLFRLPKMVTRSVCPENKTGEKGMGGMAEIGQGIASRSARELGRGWKVDPLINIKPGETAVLMDVAGPGIVQHIWMTCTGVWRNQILRMTWDGAAHPSVECPVGDFFCNGWNEFAPLSSLMVCANPGSAFNCYWPMPFKQKAQMTLTNIGTEPVTVFYQITYALGEIPQDMGYFHAQFRRENPKPAERDYTILEGARGRGRYVGTYMAWGVNNNGWWGEGEIKFFMDGDRAFPTLCGTGAEDYFCGSYNFENQKTHEYQEYCTPYAGLHQVIRPDSMYRSQPRFGMYRWHLADPICFEESLRVTIQDLGWRSGGRYLAQMSDMASVAFWYQEGLDAQFPPLPDVNALEVI